MTTITTRSGKGSPLTNDEVDANFTNLNDDKAELSGADFTGDISVAGVATIGADTGGEANVLTLKGRTSDNDGYIKFTSSDGATSYAYAGVPSANTLALYTNGFNERLVINSTGIVDIKGAGSASAPSLILAGDDDTGQFRPSANQIAWATGGTERLRLKSSEVVVNEVSADVDFRVETNTQGYAFFVDSSSNRVGIGIDVPNASLGIRKNVANSSDANPVVRLQSATAGDELLLRAQGLDDSSVARYADIAFLGDNTNEKIEFRAPYNTTSPQLILDSDNGVIMNEGSSGTRDFRVESNNYAQMLLVDAGNDRVQFGSSYTSTKTGIVEVVQTNNNSSSGFSVLGTSAATSARMYTLDDVFKIARGSLASAINIDSSNNIILNEQGEDQDFRVESDNISSMLMVDAGQDEVYVGGVVDLGASVMTVKAGTGAHNSFAVGPGVNNSVTLGNFTSNDTIANLITSSSKFGGVIQGGENGSLVLGIRDNDVTDGIFIMSGTGTGGGQMSNDYSRLRLSVTPTTFVVNETSDDADFRVESNDNANMIFVDAGSNEVGIGTGDPGATFDVAGAVRAKDMLIIQDSGYATLEMGGPSGAFIDLKSPSSDDFDGRIITFGSGMFLDVGTGSSLVLQAGGENRFEIDAGGEIAINETGLDRDFRIESDSNANMLFVDAGQNRVGIGTNDPNAELDVIGTLRFSTTNPSPLISPINNNAGALQIDTNTSVANTDDILQVKNNTLLRFLIEGNGDVQNNTGSYGSISDRRLKENIVDASSQWDDIQAIRLRKFSFISEGLSEPNMLGVIAQELEEAGLNGLVKTKTNPDTGEETKVVKHSIIYMKAVKALQEAMDKIEALESRVAQLESN